MGLGLGAVATQRGCWRPAVAALDGIARAACSKRRSRTELVRVGDDVQLAGWRVSGRRAPSGWEWQGAQSCQGVIELSFLNRSQGEPHISVG